MSLRTNKNSAFLQVTVVALLVLAVLSLGPNDGEDLARRGDNQVQSERALMEKRKETNPKDPGMVIKLGKRYYPTSTGKRVYLTPKEVACLRNRNGDNQVQSKRALMEKRKETNPKDPGMVIIIGKRFYRTPTGKRVYLSPADLACLPNGTVQ